MTLSSRRSRSQLWPALAAFVAMVFIAYGIVLVSRSRSMQERIAHDVALLEELNRLQYGLQHLGMVHRVDLNASRREWDHEIGQLRGRIDRLSRNHPGDERLGPLSSDLHRILYHADSIHQQAASGSLLGEPRHSEAIVRVLLSGAHKEVDTAIRGVHQHGLAANTTLLSRHWSEARVLLIAACLLAVVMAWLVTVSNRLLRESREHAVLMERAQRDLQHANQELRETMLSKEEKEVMLKEIHHRVKNNLQIVKSLIRFQMDQVSDPRTQELFNECVNRVSAMALVHEQTYLSQDLANIDVAGYLRSLIRDLTHAYAVGIRLTLDVDIRVRTLGVDTLVPLGLLINEIISNSFKHAFAGRGAGTIVVHLNGSEEEGLHLHIGDDGIGLPDRNNWENPRSLGMDLIHTLAGQLDLCVTLVEGTGTMYHLAPRQQLAQRRA